MVMGLNALASNLGEECLALSLVLGTIYVSYNIQGNYEHLLVNRIIEEYVPTSNTLPSKALQSQQESNPPADPKASLDAHPSKFAPQIDFTNLWSI